MLRPYSHEAFRAAERELRRAAERAADRSDARPTTGRRRGRASAALATRLRSLADRLDARPGVGRGPATEAASGPC